MAPSKVDPNKKQARSSNDKDEKHLFFVDRMANTVSGPSQAPINLVEMSPQDLYYECLDEVDARQCSIPTLSYTINMQERYAVVSLQLRSLHVQFVLHIKHFHHMVTLMRNLIVHLQHPQIQKQLKRK
jgi:hypothetical protein